MPGAAPMRDARSAWRSILLPSMAGVLCAALGEGAVAGVACARSGGTTGASAVAAIVAAGLLLLGGVPLAAAAAALLGRPASLALGRALSTALGGERGRPALATALALGAVGLAVLAGTLLGARFVAAMSGPFAGAATALVTIAALALGLLLAAAAGRWGDRALARLEGRAGHWRRTLRLLAAVALPVAVLAATLLTLPPAYAVAPTAAVAGGLIVTRRAPRLGRRGALAALIVVAAWSVIAALALPRSDARAQAAVLYRAPWVGLGLGAVRSAFDADGDGYSRVLLGGDCDDTDPNVHPAAHDVPGNGIDENCSGRDAGQYTPPPPASSDAFASRLPERPNLLLVQVDALRPDHLGSEGYHRPTSPNLDRFRHDATWFERAYTPAPSTRFAMASTFTGDDARRVPHEALGGNRMKLLPGAETVAERLQPLGYERVGYTISYVIHHNKGTGQGFDVWQTPWPVDDWKQAYGQAAEITSDAALDYLEGVPADGSRPYMLFLHYRCTHDPYIAHAEWDFGDAPVDRYDSALAYCDQQLGRVLDRVDARGDRDRTAVFIFSDHGELFGEHGLENHGNSLYEPDVRILMLARVPGGERRTVSTPVLLTDLAPTLAQLVGLEPAEGTVGRSLLPAMMGEEEAQDRPLFLFTDLWRGTIHYEASAVLRWPLKLIRDRRTGSVELYDLAEDPGERVNLEASRPAARSELAELLDSYEAWARE